MSEDLVVQLREMMDFPAETECIEFKEYESPDDVCRCP
ncbi:MAG: hypothetical protein XD82_0194 [Methanoculleus marisnigri]|uniref:Uncharacterized protein n=2 Tax=Methanoculleus marisnigri TaxID=2198 RepID=A0A101GS57_9EURY|nr:MAG: hypothetical protein XD82_0194 [Methanoculleus marisnigri]